MVGVVILASALYPSLGELSGHLASMENLIQLRCLGAYSSSLPWLWRDVSSYGV